MRRALPDAADGWNWGEPAHLGIRPETADGRYFRVAPRIAWAPAPGGGSNGRILLIGQHLLNRDGTPAAGSGRTILTNTQNDYCQDYSSPLLPSADGSRVLQIATDFEGTVCRAYFASGNVT
ncbi:hypothetical protein [Streptomyces sp. NBC_00443]|uniref:hypothetical protein n=1 Tax=Streptomyces sp. NBC_00443 TaxID=2975743 RepID=UPI002E2206EE